MTSGDSGYGSLDNEPTVYRLIKPLTALDKVWRRMRFYMEVKGQKLCGENGSPSEDEGAVDAIFEDEEL